MDIQYSTMPVYSKKLSKTVYHLATFTEPLTNIPTGQLPDHVVEERVDEPPPVEEEKEPKTIVEKTEAERKRYA